MREDFVKMFRRNANGLAIRYGAPVWLVGGALKDPEPRDYDVRMMLPAEVLQFLYGRPLDGSRTRDELYEYSPWEFRRGYDNLKHSRIMSRRMQLNIDFQIQDEFEANPYKSQQRLRLDTIPDHYFAVALSPSVASPDTSVPTPEKDVRTGAS